MEPLRIMRWIITRRAVFAGHLSPRTAVDYFRIWIRLVRVAELNNRRVSDLKVASQNVIVITRSLEPRVSIARNICRTGPKPNFSFLDVFMDNRFAVLAVQEHISRGQSTNRTPDGFFLPVMEFLVFCRNFPLD